MLAEVEPPHKYPQLMKVEPPRYLRVFSVGLLVVMLLALSIGGLRAHEDLNVHPAMTIGAFLFLDRASPEDAAYFDFGNRGRVRQSSIEEDACPNYISHFYNPKTFVNGTPDTDPPKFCGGCDRPPGFVQETAPQRAGRFWTNAIYYYRGGNTNLAMSNLGHVFHLLQDMTSPAHVHSDIHGECFGAGGCQDTDDFENWGWSNCPEYGQPFSHIFDYLSNSVTGDFTSTNQITSRLATGLFKIFGNSPQRPAVFDQRNVGSNLVHVVADKVYDFTTFGVTLEDTSNPFKNDPGAGDLKDMFPSLQETTFARWWIDEIGHSSGECGGAGPDWWLMPYDCEETGTYLDVGKAYIENTGGGPGGSALIPDTLVPRKYYHPWFTARYGSDVNTAGNTMLRIYGDVLYTTAVAYGAGLLQAFLDDAILPKPFTLSPVLMDGANVQFAGQAHPGGTNAVAWFEWYQNGGPTNRAPTPPQNIGSGSTWLNLTAQIQGLMPDTTYQCRLVSSNVFGVRYGTNQVFRTPPYILASNGTNAWQITDNSEATGSTLRYVTNLTAPQRAMATTNGWKLTVTSRFITDFGDTKAITMSYTEGGKRFLFWLDLANPGGNLFAEFDTNIVRTLTTNGIGANGYHTHEVQYANGIASYRLDGNLVLNNWGGWVTTQTPNEFPAGQVSWGATSSPGRGQANFHRIEFAIGGTNVIASYNAGTAGNPVEALNPVSQGWTRLAGVTALSEGPLSPDGESSLALAETLVASGLALQGAQLNGRVDPRGSPAAAWFEWGLTTSYGNVVALPSIPAAQGWTNVSALIGGLTQETTYHYRLVASNSFGVRFGTNRTFTTPTYLLTGASPNAWQITDSSTAGSTLYYYSTNLALTERTAATNNGWRYAVTCRMTPNFPGNETMTFYYALGGTRFLVWWNLDASGNLTAELEGQSPRIMATSGAGATNFHTHELVYDPATRRAAYWFDGNLVTNWPGAGSVTAGGQVGWGAGSSPGRGQMNFHRAEFTITGLGTPALYDAGTAGDPAMAPDPTTRGWTLTSGAGTSAAISPDISFQSIPDAETLAASAVGPNAAQLNASVNARGLSTDIWFEWGTTAAYGNRTIVQNLSGSGATPVAQALSGLAVDTTYYYRVVASNEFAVSFGSAQTLRTGWFQDSGVQLAAVDIGAVAWGDYDTDGYLDLVITGLTDTNRVTALYRNLGGTNFIAVNSGFPAARESAVAWGDYNNDGYLDLALSGLSPTGNVSRIYANAQNGTFTNANAGLIGLRWSSVTWSDYDNDGDLDLLLAGLDDLTTNAITRLYVNDRRTNFVAVDIGLPGVIQGSAAWSDCDGDGDQDVVLIGRDNSQNQISRLYRNDGSGIFSDIGAALPGVDAGSVAWGDYDIDGDPDLLLTGWNGYTYITHLFRNDRTGQQITLVDTEVNLPEMSSSSAVWGDYDNDGDLDILMAGFSGNYSAYIFRNDGGTFVNAAADLTGVTWASAAWADYDNDGDLDALVTGLTSSNRVCRIYRNGTTVANVPPAAPTGLAGFGAGNTATVSWDAAIDSTPASPLTYNVLLSTTNGASLTGPMSDVASGFRRVVQTGNAGDNLSATFTGLKPGTYQFTVQAIDSSFAGGPFAPWQTLQVASYPVGIVNTQIPAPGQFRLYIVAGPGSTCEVLRSDDLAIWGEIGAATEVEPGRFEFLDVNAPVTSTFYRVRSTPAP